MLRGLRIGHQSGDMMFLRTKFALVTSARWKISPTLYCFQTELIFFDNSQDGEPSFAQLAEITEGEDIDIVSDTQPAWFQQYVIDKLT